ncbi:MAG TPA: cupin domain-containing protein [Actinomycetota bacterium]
MDRLVTGGLMRLPGMRLVRDGATVPVGDYTRTIRIGSRRVPETVRPERVVHHFARGATIVLQALHRQWPPIAAFCRRLELDLTHPVQANAYVTPATSRGFAVHHDTHDVFVIQTHGRKGWRVYLPVIELAGKEQPWSSELGDPGAPILETELSPGDVLYIPRGFPHDATAREEVSIHVTVGIQARTWLDVWRHVMEQAPEHAPFREALPIGFARDREALAGEVAARLPELRSWLEKAAGPEAAASFAEGFWDGRPPVLGGQLEQVAQLDAVDVTTPLRVRAGAIFRPGVEGEEAVARLGTRILRMPGWVEPALRFVAEAVGPFTPRELPNLNPGSALVLCRRLIVEGVLEADG